MLPSINDTEFDLLRKLVTNTAALGAVEATVAANLAINGVVQTYSQLPTDLGQAPLQSVYLVLKDTGIWPMTDHSAGLYVREGSDGVLADWEKT